MKKVKQLLLVVRRLYLSFFSKGSIVFGKNLNIHPRARLVCSEKSKISIADNCVIADQCIVCAENQAIIELGGGISIQRSANLLSKKNFNWRRNNDW